MMWWTRNEDGFWCNFCGDLLKPSFHLECAEEWDEFEEDLEDGCCCKCGAPDDFDPDSI